MDQLVIAVKEHARKHYNEDGWDILELYDDTDIVEAIGCASTKAGAIRNVGKELRTHLRR
jgi:hypothetical protein